MRTFPSRPLPNFKCLRRALSSDVIFYNDLMFFDLGREALVRSLEELSVKSGASILIPGYMCDSTIAPLRNLGYDIIFFDVKEDLDIDLAIIKNLITNSKVEAILAVHYFGFPTNIQDLVSLCDKHNVKVIEDCAHSYLSKIQDKSVGLFGDISIYSMRKTLAVPDGGALKLNSDNPIDIEVVKKKIHWLKESLYLGSRILESIIFFIGYPNLYSSRVEKIKQVFRNIQPNNHKNSTSIVRTPPIKSSFQLNAYLNDIKYMRYIIQTRRNNYNFLAEETQKLGLRSFFPQLPDGCVPQFFILIDKKRQLAQWLNGNGIGAVTWPGPELLEEIGSRRAEFPVTNYLNDHLVMLPIHQSLDLNDMFSMIDLLKKWVQSVE